MQTSSHYPHVGGTAMGRPSGNDADGGFTGYATNVNTKTDVDEYSKHDHSVNIKDTDVSPAPLRPVFGPGEGPFPKRSLYSHYGGTAMEASSGEDGSVSFGNPTSVGVDSNVNEHSEDNHAIKVDTTHPPAAAIPHMPWMPYDEETPIEHPTPAAVPEAETPEEAPAPPSAPHSAPIPEDHEEQPTPPSTTREDQDDHEEVPQCTAQTQEVVRTVTKTQYKEVHPTLTVYATPVVSQAVQTTAAVPMSATPEESYADPKVVYSAPAAPSSSVPYQSYNYNSQRPMSSSAAYSMIPVQASMATPSSSRVMMSMATPSSSHGLHSGADALQRPSTSAKPSVVMFQGSAARVSGGIASVAAAVVGVLAFVL